MEIRNAKSADAKEISKMYDELIDFELKLYKGKERKIAADFDEQDRKTSRQIIKILSSRKTSLLVAEENAKLIGFLNGTIEPVNDLKKQKAGKFDIFVRRNHRRKGTGSALIGEFIRWLKKKKCAYIYLYAFAANEKAKRFYEKEKFTHLSNFYVKKIQKK